jgi:hypothetical protein
MAANTKRLLVVVPAALAIAACGGSATSTSGPAAIGGGFRSLAAPSATAAALTPSGIGIPGGGTTANSTASAPPTPTPSPIGRAANAPAPSGTGVVATASSGGTAGGASPTSTVRNRTGVCAYLDDAVASDVAGAPVELVSGTGAMGGDSQCIYGNNDQGSTLTMAITDVHGDAKTALENFFAGMGGVFQPDSRIGADAAGVTIADTIVELAFVKGTVLVTISADGGTGADPNAVQTRVEVMASQIAAAL